MSGQAAAVARHKHFIRQIIKARVLALPVSKRRAESARVLQRLARLSLFKRAHTVALTFSLPHEVDTAPIVALCRKLGKRVAAPVVDPARRRMIFYEVPIDSSGTRRNVYGLREPSPQHAKPVAIPLIDLFIVPGQAFTRGGDRLGFGGGFFDRCLARGPKNRSVALAFDEQVVARIPVAPHDVPMKVILTPSKTYKKY